MSGDELSRIDGWIVSKLTAAAAVTAITSRVYADLAPQGSVFPYVLFACLSSRDVQGAAADRIMVDATYVIRGVHQAETYLGDVQSLADAIDAALDQSSGTNGSASILSCTRIRPFRMTEVESGAFQTRHSGGVYRILVQL